MPLTRAFNREGKPKRVYVWELRVRVDNQAGKIMTDQIHNIDKRRFQKKIGELTPKQMEEVMKKLRILITFFPTQIKAKL
jgi:mRNA-degrading endonuclease toxin of MazEF toxin-antitoxin module